MPTATIKLVVFATALVVILQVGTARAQSSPPKYGPDTGRRVFITATLEVPVKPEEQGGLTRTIQCGSVAKIIEINGRLAAYDDAGLFEVSNDQYSVLSNNLEESLKCLREQSAFVQHLASGNYFLNVDLSQARIHFQRALAEIPSEPAAMLGLALAQSEPNEKRGMLAGIPSEPASISLLARTYLAKMNSDYTEMERISKQAASPALVHLDMLAYLLLQKPDLATPDRVNTIMRNAGEYGPTPRLLNLTAMFLQSDIFAKQIPINVRIEDAFGLSNAALDMDPWYYHAHMTIAGLMYSGKHYPQAAEHYEKALLLNPVCIEAIEGLAALSSTPGFQPPESSFVATYDMNSLLAQMRVVKNSDLEIDFQHVPEIFVHGFCNVNHGGKQPRKLDLLRQRKSELAIEYLGHLSK